MKFIKNNVLSNGSRLVIIELDPKIIDHLYDIKLNPEELHTYRSITNDKRKCEYLSIRKAIQTLYNENEFIAYTSNGKPNLAISGHKVSISHSKGLLGIITHPDYEVGIDLQHETDKIIRIKNRFMAPDELEASKSEEWQLLAYWCAKEALFKYYSKGNVDFRTNLHISPFELSDEGVIEGEIHMPDMHTHLPLGYERIADTMIVYTLENC